MTFLATFALFLPIVFMSISGVFLTNSHAAKGGHMPSIVSTIYMCKGREILNPQRWWTAPIPDPENKDVYYLCGGNAAAESGAGVEKDSCMAVDLANCTVMAFKGSMSVPRVALLLLAGQQKDGEREESLPVERIMIQL